MRPGKIIDFISIARLKFLIIGGFLPFVFGLEMAVLEGAPFSLDIVIMIAAVMFLTQLSVSYCNDYFDLEVDTHNYSHELAGKRVLVREPGLRELSKYFSLLCMALSLAILTVMVLAYRLSLTWIPMYAVGLAIIWYYSAPPIRLAYRGHGIGEAANVVTFGHLIPAIAFTVLAGVVSLTFMLYDIPFMMGVLAGLLCFEILDVEGDKIGGKRTLIVYHGKKIGFYIIGALMLGSAAFVAGMGLLGIDSPINNTVMAAIYIIPFIVMIGSYALYRNNGRLVEKLIGINKMSIFLTGWLINAYLLILILT